MPRMSPAFSLVGVLGAGAMGRGIAQMAVQAGCHVLLHDTNADSIQASIASIHAQWTRMAEKEKITTDQFGNWTRALDSAATSVFP